MQLVCEGLKKQSGDMYGGAHYITSADVTAQGKAIHEAAVKFGDGKTLPFAPCKRYYNPWGSDEDGSKIRMYGCRLHSDLREKRVRSEGYRAGEKNLEEFWGEVPERPNK